MKKLATFYRPEQNAPNMKSFSPSARKPKEVVDYFQTTGLIEVKQDWEPLTRSQIKVAHNSSFVDGVLDLKIANGFGNYSPELAASLPYTQGSFYNAALYAVENQTVAFSPTSGFHHAGFKECEGFCTFNGLAVSAFLLWKQQKVKRVGIIDFDCHYGNGTDDILDKFSNGREIVEHLTFGQMINEDEKEGKRRSFDRWLDDLPLNLAEQFAACDVLFYQAGADPHVEDPYGGYLTTEQMKRRDEIVFDVANKLFLPIVWNLAGGYQTPLKKVLDLHLNTLNACHAKYLL